MTAAEARARFRAVVDEHGRQSNPAEEAWREWCAAAFAEGHPLDSLRIHSRSETERFFARTVNGPDGHVYWTGSLKGFTRNDGKMRVANRWWWEHANGPITDKTWHVRPWCRDRACINPEHSKCEPFQRDKYSRQQLLDILRAQAARLGRTPTSLEWDQLGLKPNRGTYDNRFGAWSKAILEAGLTPPSLRASADDCIRSLQAAREFLGRWPLASEYRGGGPLGAHLKALGLPRSSTAISKRLSPIWADALRRAGAE